MSSDGKNIDFGVIFNVFCDCPVILSCANGANTPISVAPKGAVIKHQEATSRSQKLMLDQGLIKSAATGTFYILPILQRAIDKCVRLVEKSMSEIDAQKISLPILTSSNLWEKSGRLNEFGELLSTTDRLGKEYILSPTHEESITHLIAATGNMSYKNLPLRLYQIGPKFRDELKPRFGLIRAREFIMKDLYSFDVNYDEAKIAYDNVTSCYEKLFNLLNVPWIRVEGDSGAMGGNISHEYHILANVGEDIIVKCSNCNFASNQGVCGEVNSCPKCGSHKVETLKGIEIGHTFLLGEKYSQVFGATYLQSNGKPSNLIMGCYGIGVTRLIAASVEALSNEGELRWPEKLSPFDVCIIPPKKGSKEDQAGIESINKLFSEVVQICDPSAIIVDDRTNLTIGKRLIDCKKTGYPVIIVAGAKILDHEAKFEIHSSRLSKSSDVTLSELCEHIKGINFG